MFLLMICYFELKFVKIPFRDFFFFSIFVVLRNITEGKSVKWQRFWNGVLFNFFSQIIIIWHTLSMVQFLSENSTGKVFSEVRSIGPPLGIQRVGNNLVTQVIIALETSRGRLRHADHYSAFCWEYHISRDVYTGCPNKMLTPFDR